MVLLLGLLSGGLLAGALLHLRQEALNAGERSTRSLAHLVGEQTTRSLQAVRQALQLSWSEMEQLRAAATLNEASARPLLRKQLEDLPFVRAIWVLNEHGVITHDSDVGNIGVSLADRDYFRVHLEYPKTQFFVGKPVRSRSVGTWLVSAALPIRSSDGRLQGVIAAAIEPPYFDRLWGTVDVGDGGSINLFTRDGVLMMRSPYIESAIGQSFAETAAFVPLVRSSPTGTLSGKSAIDGKRRIVSFHQLPEHPDLVAVVGSAHDTVLEAWRRFAAIAMATWVAALAATTALCLLWIREWDRRLRSEERQLQSRKMESIGTLAGGIAHDFNNILAAILGNVAIAREEIGNAGAARTALEQIHHSGLRARSLVRQILSFSRGQPQQLTHVALAPLVDEMHLWVADTGRGIPQEIRTRIFEPFFTTRSKGGGTGLGLSVVHGIVAAHHGAITVNSEANSGSTFHVYLPLAAEHTEDEQGRNPSMAVVEGQGQCVLYLDDDDVILLMVKALLERSGFRVATFTRAADALNELRAHPTAFDVVVTDYDMPAMSGLELAQALSRELPHVPVIMSSGYVSDELREKARAAGVRELLNKENSYADLVAAVSRAVCRSEPDRSA